MTHRRRVKQSDDNVSQIRPVRRCENQDLLDKVVIARLYCVVILLEVSTVVHRDLIVECMSNQMANSPWEADCHCSDHCLQRGRSKLVHS